MTGAQLPNSSSPRRYIAVVQDPRGYPSPGAPLDPAPPEGPTQPVVHSVVLAEDYDALVKRTEVSDEMVERARSAYAECKLLQRRSTAQDAMRAALLAAFSTQHATEGDS